MEAKLLLATRGGARQHCIPCCLLLVILSGAGNCLGREEWFRGLDLEPALGDASLVMVARVTDVSEARILFGGKAETTLQQFKFQPAQVLKGVFSRESLSLTSQDLGIQHYPDSPPLEPGQLRLLMLARSPEGYAIYRVSANLDQAIPPLRDLNDGLIESCKILLAVHAASDRGKRVELLRDGLEAQNGPPAVPLLAALERRALLAAQTPAILESVLPHLSDASPAVREQAARTIAPLLDADYLRQPGLRQSAANALLAALKKTDWRFEPRVAMFAALGEAGSGMVDRESLRELLAVDPPSTFAEQGARLHALGDLEVAGQQTAVLALLRQLPLDAPLPVQYGAEWALAKLDPSSGVREIMMRAGNKSESGLGIQVEINVLGDLPPDEATPALLDASKLPLDDAERQAFVTACDKVAEKSADNRLVAPLASMLDSKEPDVKWGAVDALLKIDTDDSAKALQPQLRPESNLLRKLEIAELLGRHGIRDGYPYAIEHMSEPYLLEQAVSALAAIREPGAVAKLREILATSNDAKWNRAAVRCLGRLGASDLAPQFLEMAKDSKSPLAPSALIALGDLHEPRALAIVRAGLNSRSAEMLVASARAAGTLAGLPAAKADDVRDQLASLLADAQALQEARAAALNSLAALNDPRLDAALAQAARDGGIEESDLLARVEQLLRQRKVRLL